MPTGYTSRVADGTVTELEPFVLDLARGMGALITMRDEPSNAPIPERFEPSSYNADKLVGLRAERKRLYEMTDAEAEAAAVAEFAKDEAEMVSYLAKRREERSRYEAMIAKVKAWSGAPEGVKEFGLEQLERGMEFDCGKPGHELDYWKKPVRLSGEDWRIAQLEKVSKDIEYHSVEDAKERARTDSRNAWIAQLRASLVQS
jgi:hypothetical protein